MMAAAATPDIAETAMLDRAVDLPMPAGLVVLPEPVLLANRNGALSDVRAFGWQPVDLHNEYPDFDTGVPGVLVSAFLDRDGPVQPEDWHKGLAVARAAGYPFPKLIPDGEEGMVGRGDFKDKSVDELRELSEELGQVHAALAANTRQEAQDVGEWQPGQVIDDRGSTFNRRYMFAFWRLLAQGSVGLARPAADLGSVLPGSRRTAAPPDPSVRVVQLSAARRTADGEAAQGSRVYHHRWTVRMHKVRQWYPSLREHKIIWRGPYIKGPADAPMIATEKIYSAE
jgi:hypothetical protein